MPLVAGLALPALSGLLLALSFPPFHLLLPSFVALVPAAVWAARVVPEARTVAVRGGVTVGAVYFGLLFHWVPVALFGADPGLPSAAFATLAWIVIVLGLAALTGVSFGLLHHAVQGLTAPLWLALPVTWTALEWTRAHLPDSLALPWLGLGTSLTGYPELAGAAEIVGARGLTFWLAAVNGLLATAWLRRRGGWRRWCVPALAAAVLAAGVGGWGMWRAQGLDLRIAARVAVVQPAVAQRTKVTGSAPTAASVSSALPPVVAEAAEGAFAVEAGALDLVVLPELFLRADPRTAGAAEPLAVLRDFSRRADAPVLFGALGGDGASPPYNSAFVTTPDGLTDFRYDKHRLVPLVERIPFRPTTPESGYARGREWPLAEVAGFRYGVLVCYESSYPEVARALRLAGADVLVNVTNDAWLGGPGRSTVALWQHPAHLVMRAIEGRVGVVRAAATGVSLFVDPLGRVHQATDISVPAVRAHSVQTTDAATFYIRYGDLTGRACAILALGLLIHALMLLRRGQDAPSLDPKGSLV